MAQYNSMEEFGKALQRAYNGLDAEIELALKENVPELANAISLRVSMKGTNRDGGSFSTPYSKSHKWKRNKYGNGSIGRQTSYKGFYYQGTMWDSFGLKKVQKSGKLVTASVGFEGDNLYTTNAVIVKNQSDRENIFIGAANKEEALELTRKIGASIGQYLISVL